MNKKINGFNEIGKFSDNINTINKYFSYLRKKRRGDLNILLDKPEIDKFGSIDEKVIQELVRENLLVKDYLCTGCHRVYDEIEDYYRNLPFIFLGMDTDSIFIAEIFCSGCRVEMGKRIIEMGDYTCLKIHCILKDEYVEVIKRLYEIKKEMGDKAGNVDEIEKEHNPWRELLKEFDIPFIKKWLIGKSRTFNIPSLYNAGYELESWDWVGLKRNEWKFIVEMKNYYNEFNTFISLVLLKICTKIIHCEYYECFGIMEDSIMIYENYDVKEE